ncbi:MAG TPA: GMC family oxidoreductase N-terminal domain-containing protein, partial [Candidatus Eisenbacteria bacterium]|nr:GMC family oxidoreductase N-terminal domain-containing protein [Candidatus Eisenbacteria bacterium]
MEADFEYVVVGSGAGGGPLAANLALAGHKVLLLEAGGCADGLDYHVPAFHALATEDPDMRWDFFVRHYDDDRQQARDSKFVPERGGVLYPRAGTLGGCTAHNAMITVYPHNHDWDELAALTGDPSWSSGRMRGYFERLERCLYETERRPPRSAVLRALARLVPWLGDRYGNLGRHGFDGWLATSLADPWLAVRDQQLVRVVISAAQQALSEHLGRGLRGLQPIWGFPDPNDWRVQRDGTEGLWLVPMAVRDGRRVSARDRIQAVLRDHPGNLTVRTGALATRVLLEGDRALGIELVDGAHLYRADPRAATGEALPRAERVVASREVVLSAGAFNTPQLLKLSGIGPRDELAALGI